MTLFLRTSKCTGISYNNIMRSQHCPSFFFQKKLHSCLVSSTACWQTALDNMTLSSFKLKILDSHLSINNPYSHCFDVALSETFLRRSSTKSNLMELFQSFLSLQACVNDCQWFQICLCWGIRLSVLHKKWPVNTCFWLSNAHLVWKLWRSQIAIFSSPVGNHLTIGAHDPESLGSLEFLHSQQQ